MWWQKDKPQTKQAFATCAVCGTAINIGEPYNTLQWTLETFDGRSVTVQEAEVIAYYCQQCAQQLDFSRLHVPQK